MGGGLEWNYETDRHLSAFLRPRGVGWELRRDQNVGTTDTSKTSYQTLSTNCIWDARMILLIVHSTLPSGTVSKGQAKKSGQANRKQISYSIPRAGIQLVEHVAWTARAGAAAA